MHRLPPEPAWGQAFLPEREANVTLVEDRLNRLLKRLRGPARLLAWIA